MKVEDVPLPAVVLGDGEEIVAANALAAELLGERETALQGRAFGELLPAEELTEWRERDEGRAVRLVGRRADGLVWRADAHVGRQCVLLVPVPPPVRWGDETLRRADVREPLDIAISHDLRGHLRVIESFVTIVSRQVSDETAQAHLQRVRKAAEESDRFVSRVVEYIRLEKTPVSFRRLTIGQLVDKALVRSVTAERPRPSDVVVTERDLTVHADPTLVTEVFCELFENAAKFSDGTARVEVAAARDQGWVRVVVSDDGPGIPPDLAEAAMEPGRMLQPRGSYPGVGMGLPLVARMVEVQGGRIRLDRATIGGLAVHLRFVGEA
ncbi:MAG: hypothetical protein KatS3mg008_1221 [Acidimicrobiales bacterium]|nr:MAG: hypothetical protein KatS3mg008_1221 [Acidimicrobiales bacterium]